MAPVGIVPALDEVEERHALLDRSLGATAVQQYSHRAGEEALAHGVGEAVPTEPIDAVGSFADLLDSTRRRGSPPAKQAIDCGTVDAELARGRSDVAAVGIQRSPNEVFLHSVERAIDARC